MILYTNQCPKCKILKMKLDDKNIQYEIVNDMNIFVEKGFRSMPHLEVEGSILDFANAIKYVNKLN